MVQTSDSKGNIVTRQGDTFYIPLTLTPEEAAKKGTLFVQVINSKRKQMFPDEPRFNVSPTDININIPVPASYSDLLTVPKTEDYEDYSYAVKHCTTTGVEDTWVIGGMELDELPIIRVFPKVVNGGIGEDEPDPVPETYTYWRATVGDEPDVVVYTGYTVDGNTSAGFTLVEPTEGNYVIDTMTDDTLTITTEEEIPTTYTIVTEDDSEEESEDDTEEEQTEGE